MSGIAAAPIGCVPIVFPEYRPQKWPDANPQLAPAVSRPCHAAMLAEMVDPESAGGGVSQRTEALGS